MKLRAFTIAVVMLSVLMIAAFAAYGEGVTQYAADVHIIRIALDSEADAKMQRSPAPGKHAASDLARKILLPIKMLQDRSGRVYPVDNGPLMQQIVAAEGLRDGKKSAAALSALGSRLRETEADLLDPTPKRTPTEARLRASKVLQEPEFQSQPAPDPSAFEKFGDTVAKWIADHWPKLKTPAGPTWSPNVHVIWAIVIILATALFALLVWLIVGAVGRRAVRARPPVLDDAEAALVEARDTDSLLDLADARARSGDYRGAFRMVYLATLVALDTGGTLRFDRSKTNWEYLRDLRAAGRSDISDLLRPLTQDFDRLWYGSATAGPSDYERARQQYELLTRPVAAVR